MSAGAAEWVWANSRAANGSLIVLLAIADAIDREGKAEMSVAELAGKARLSDRAVQLGVRDLGRLGEVSVTPKSGPHGRNGYRIRPWEVIRRGEDISPLPVPDHGRPGEESAPVKNLHPEESSPLPMVIHSPAAAENGANPQASTVKGEDISPLGAVDNFSDMFVVPTGRSLVEVKDVPAKRRRDEDRPDADRLCEHLAARIVANGSRPPAITQKWRDAARLLLDKDGMTEQQVHAAIDWCQDSEFWRANILSMPKLREKYDQLRQQARRQPKANGANHKLGIVASFLERAGNE